MHSQVDCPKGGSSILGSEWGKKVDGRDFSAGAVVINDTLMHVFGTLSCMDDCDSAGIAVWWDGCKRGGYISWKAHLPGLFRTPNLGCGAVRAGSG